MRGSVVDDPISTTPFAALLVATYDHAALKGRSRNHGGA